MSAKSALRAVRAGAEMVGWLSENLPDIIAYIISAFAALLLLVLSICWASVKSYWYIYPYIRDINKSLKILPPDEQPLRVLRRFVSQYEGDGRVYYGYVFADRTVTIYAVGDLVRLHATMHAGNALNGESKHSAEEMIFQAYRRRQLR